MEKKYTFKLTLDEMRMIRNALELEAERREKGSGSKVEEYNALVEFFYRRIDDARNGKED